VALLALSGCGSKPAAAGEEDKGPSGPVAVEIVKTEKRAMRQLLDLSGSFAPSQGSSAKLSAATAGRVATVLVKEGDHVQKGQLLASIDLRVQAGQRESAAAGSAAAQAQASQSELAYQAAKADQDSTVRSAEIALDQAKLERDSSISQAALAYTGAKADLEKLRAGPRPQEVAQAHEATVQARVARDKARAEYQRNLQLVPDGFVSKRQVEEAKTAAETADSALSAAEASESLVKAGARPEELRAAEARSSAAQEAATSARTIGDRKVALAESTLAQARHGVISLQAKRKDVETALATAKQKAADASSAAGVAALGEIRAPFEGVITRRNLNPGDYADTTNPVLEIAATGKHVDFVAGAIPALANQVHAGMEASIDFEPEAIEGRVLSVSPADPQTGLCSIRIACSSTAVSGTFASAHVILKVYPNAVAAPQEAILDRDGKSIVFKVVDGAAKQTEVKTGPEDGGFVALLSGVAAGDELVKLGSYELTDGQKVTPPKEDDKKGADDKKESGS
jgi:RND family efflux transporter MFP subunit